MDLSSVYLLLLPSSKADTDPRYLSPIATCSWASALVDWASPYILVTTTFPATTHILISYRGHIPIPLASQHLTGDETCSQGHLLRGLLQKGEKL